MKDITPQQQKVLDCIQVYINKTGFPPTRADICKELGFKSPNSAETHLRALEKKNFITIESGASRGISINNPEVKHEDFMYLTDPIEKMNKCKESVRKVFKLKQDTPIVHPMMIDILKCMKTTNNFEEYRNCYHN